MDALKVLKDKGKDIKTMHKTVIAVWKPGKPFITVRGERGEFLGNLYTGQIPESVHANGSKVFAVCKGITIVYECSDHPHQEAFFYN